jgi:hypothetical protein
MQSGLSGYSSPELQAQREAMQREGNNAYKTSLDQAARTNARSGLRGGAAAAMQAKMAGGYQQSRDQQEQDIFLKNADEMQKRLGAYGQYTSGLEKDEYGRAVDTRKDYATSLDKVQGDEYTRAQETQNNLTTATDKAQSTELDKQKYNLGNQALEKAGYVSTITGLSGVEEQRKANADSNAIQKQYMDLAARMYGNQGGGSSTPQTTSSAAQKPGKSGGKPAPASNRGKVKTGGGSPGQRRY